MPNTSEPKWMERLEAAPEGQRPISGIEVNFSMPVYLTSHDYQRLAQLIDSIVQHSCNQPVGGIHWASGWGDKPMYSTVDAALLGVAPAPEAVRPKDGAEPQYDSSVFSVQTTVREFVCDKERKRVQNDRERLRERGWAMVQTKPSGEGK